MNKHLYRVIFNAKRGVRMAVAETTTAQGKDAGDTISTGHSHESENPQNALFALSILAPIGLALALSLGSLMSSYAQIVADPNAPRGQQAVVITAGNGVPVVNIQTPTAGGVSMNQFSQFNVNTNGAILNNARNNTQTTLGGWIQGNPYLATGTASVIVNQVNSNNPTLLNGYIEVAGQRAQVIIANPSGIQVNGAGFINAQSAVLTTGIPNFNGNVVTGYTVNQGTVQVNGNGLDLSTTDYSSILARAVQVNAGIWAKNLAVVTGSNQIDASVTSGAAVTTTGAAPTVIPVAGAGTAPTFAIDVSSLGGMYAGKILLIGTEAGLGVNLKGTVMGINTGLLAGPGEVTISHNGWLSNSGTIQSATTTAINTVGDTNNSGNIYAGTNTALTATGNITNSGLIAAQGNVQIQATGANSHITSTNTSVLAAGLNANGTLQSLGTAGDLSVAATQSTSLNGQTIASNNLSATGTTVSLANSSTFAVNVQVAASSGDLNTSGANIQATNSLQLTTPTALITSGAGVTSPNVSLSANSWNNSGGQVVHTGAQNFTVNLAGALDNTGGVIQTTNAQGMSLTANSVNNARGQIAQTYNVSGQMAGLTLSTATGNFGNANGTIYTTGNLGLQSGALDNSNGTTVALGSANLNTTALQNNGGLIQATNSLHINTNGATLTNTNTASAGLIAGGALTVNAGAIDNSAGRIANTGNQSTTLTASSLNSTNGLIVGEALTINTGAGQVTNANGTVYARGNLSVQSGQLTNTNGTIATNASALLNTTGIQSVGGLIQSTGSLDINTNGGAFNNANTSNAGVISGGALTVSVGVLNNAQGRIVSTGTQNTSITAASLDNTNSLIAAQNLTLATTGSSNNTNGTIYARGDLSLQSAVLTNANGTLVSGTNMVLNISSLESTAGLVQSGGNLTLNTNGGALTNANTSNAGIIAAGQLLIQTGSLDNSQGRIANTGNQSTTITATSLNSTNGLIVGESLTINTGTGAIGNANGTIYARIDLNVQSGQLTNTNGTLAANNNLALNTTSIQSDAGLIQANGNVTLNTNGGLLTNSNTVNAGIVSGGQITITAGAVDNAQGRIASTGNQTSSITATSLNSTNGLIVGEALQLNTGTGSMNNANGTVYARGNFTLQSGVLTNTNGTLASNASGNLSTTGIDNTKGLIQTTNALTVSTNGGAFNNANTSSAGVVSGGQLTITAGAIQNANGQIVSTGAQNATITAASLNNTNAVLAAQNLSLQLGSGELVNTNGTIYTRADLTLQSGNVTNTLGTLAASGQATLNTATYAGDNGLLQAGGNLTLNTQGAAFTQSNAALYAQNLNLSTGAFTNTNSTVIARGDLNLASGALTNSNNSTLAAAGNATLNTGAVTNDHSLIQAGSALTIQTNGANLTNTNTQFINSTIGLVAGTDLSVQAGNTNNTLGRMASGGNANLTVATLANTNGVIVANGLNVASTGQAANTNGTLYAQNITLTASELANTNGTVLALGNAQITAPTITNTQGLIQAGANLTLTAANAVTNANTQFTNSTIGIVAGGNLTVTTPTLDNTGGRVALMNTNGTAQFNTNTLTNNNGSLLSVGNLSVTGNSLTNANGAIAAFNDANLTVSSLNNDAGLLQTGGNLAIASTSLSNQNTGYTNSTIGVVVGGNLGVQSTSVNNALGRIVAYGNTSSVQVTANALDNTNGTLASLNNVNLQLASLNNTNGTISATNNLTSTVTGLVANTNGVLYAGNTQTLNAGSLTGDGSVLSGTDLNVTLGSSYTHGATARFAAARHASLNVNGDITNNGKLQAGGYLNVSSANLDNTAAGEIAGYITNINATNTVTNRGLIDGVSTQITAGNINNIGTGRIYGDYIGLQANNILNDAETVGGTTTAATIAARQRLDIGVSGTLTNTNNALIYSDGNIVIGGALDANRTATGMAGLTINNGSTIEAANALVINASSIQNLNRNFSYALTTVAGTATTSEFVTSGGTLNSNSTWNTGRGYLVSGGAGGGLRYYYEGQVSSGTDENGSPIYTTGNAGFAGSGNTKGFVLNPSSIYNTPAYKAVYNGANVVNGGLISAPASSSTWGLLGVPQATNPPPSGARPPLVCESTDGDGYCLSYTSASIAAGQAWDTAAAPYQQLQAAINTLRTNIESQSVSYDGWRDYTTNTEAISLTSTNPGKMLSGGSMLLNAGTSLVNNMSQIVAGGTLSVTGAAVDNRQLTVTTNNTRVGTAYTWRQYDHGCGGLKGCDYNYQAYGGSAYSLSIPTTTTLGVATSVSNTAIAPLASNAQIATRVNSSAVQEVSVSLAKSVMANNTLKEMSGVSSALAIRDSGNVTVTAPSANTTAVTISPITLSNTSSNVTVVTNGTGFTSTNGTHVNYAANRVNTSSPTYFVTTVGNTVSNNSLFRTPANSTARYFVETDPRFTNYRQWLSSDYMLQALALDPQQVQKRLGDGFYEQRLIREQVLALTGTRFLDGYSDDETQYADLMNNAVTYAKAWNLRPGIALTDEQMAALTSDIVWLVEKEVTLADGSKVRALVPQLYTKLRSGDLNESGALLGGTNVVMSLTGDANNYGTIAGRNIVSLTANNINNLNNIQGNAVSLNAKQDINVIGGQVQAASALYATAGRNINVASTGTNASNSIGQGTFSYQGIDRVAGLYVGATNGTLAMNAGGNINLTAANIINSGLNSATSLQANGSINLATIRQGSSNSVVIEAGKQFLKDGQSSEVGTSIIGGGNVTMSAANVNLRAANIQSGIAANATNNGTGALVIAATNNINVTAGVATQDYAFADKKKIGGGGLFGSDGETVTTRTSNNTFAQGSNLGGNTVTLQAGSFSGNGTQSTAGSALGNINVVGSNILSTNGTNLIATGNVSVSNAVNTFNSTFSQQTTESGFLSGGSGIGFTYGDRTQRQTNNQSGTSATASTIGSTNGSVNIAAGNNVNIVGSNVVTGTLNSTSNKLEGTGDINIQGANVSITEARETTTGQSTTFFEQSGLTVAVSVPGMAQAQGAASTLQAASRTSNSRVQALGLITAGMQAASAAQAAGSASSSGVRVSATVGTSTSKSQTDTASNNAAGSNIQAAGNVNINATAGNLTIQGSDVSANNNVSLVATGDVNLLAAANTNSQKSTSSSSSSSVGVAASVGGQGGMQFGVTGSVSGSRGNADGQDLTYTNTNVNAGNTLNIQSGGNTNLIGAVATGNTTNVNVGGNLVIQSLQDKSTYDSKDTSFSASATVGYGASASLSLGKTTINSNFQSVNQTSGIRAGDGGFNVQVGGNTTLIGGQITSNQSAITNNLNTFSTNGTLTTSDIQNSSQFDAKSVSVTVGTNGGGAGVGAISGSQSSTTVAAISGGNISVGGVRTNTSSNGNSLNTNTTTGQNDTGIKNDFNAATVRADVQAQVQITQAFGQNAARFVGDLGASKMKPIEDANRYTELKSKDAASLSAAEVKWLSDMEGTGYSIDKANAAKADPANIENYNNWKEGGSSRVAAHAVVGAMGGGLQGALGSTTLAALAPELDNLQNKVAGGLVSLGVSPETAKGLSTALAQVTALSIGTAVGGAQGGMTGLNTDANNRQLHPDERKWARNDAEKFRNYLASKTDKEVTLDEAYQLLLSAGYGAVDDQAAKSGKGGQSERTALQFLNENKPSDLFNATAAERANPFLNGNADRSWTPEQQARWGKTITTVNLNQLLTDASGYLGNDCGTNCKQKFESIDKAIGGLNSMRTLYQDSPEIVAQIDKQIDALKTGITKDELARGMSASYSDTYKNIAGLVLGNPSRIIAGKATAETLELVGLTQAIKDARVGLPAKGGAQDFGNVAAASIDIDGLPKTMVASSRVEAGSGNIVGNGGRNFNALENVGGNSIDRRVDSEYKILDNIADKLGNNTSATGTVKIVTERPACDSCLDVAQQFRAKYPNIEVKIYDNNGLLLTPVGTKITPAFNPSNVGVKK